MMKTKQMLRLDKLKKALPDIQQSKDVRGKRINKVGIRNLILPIKILDAKKRIINSVADFSMYCDLVETEKGVSMSRFTEILHDVLASNMVSSDIVCETLDEMKRRLKANNNFVKMKFPYFMKKKAPVSKLEGYIHYPIVIEGKMIEGKVSLFVTVEVPYTSLCPCSKEISKFGAHNQPSTASITVEVIDDSITYVIESLIKVVEQTASCDMYSVLKRPDEKYVTEHAYKNPRFVEDMAREIALKLDNYLNNQIDDYVVVVNHNESIHTHVATAVINAGKRLR